MWEFSRARRERRGTYVYQSEVGHQRLDLPDDLGLGTSIERLELNVEHRLFFGLLLYTLVKTKEWVVE